MASFYGNVFDYFNTFSAVLDWWFLSKPECQKLSYLVSRVLDLRGGGGGVPSIFVWEHHF